MASSPEAQARLAHRLPRPPLARLGARTTLRHFALITYALPPERLAPHVDTGRFEIETFPIGGRQLALLSAVPFLDVDFRFPRLLSCARFGFGQTNHRLYVRERASGEPMVWFLGTTLGSAFVAVPRLLWRLPWHRARYRFDCEWDAAARRYRRYRIEIASDWCAGEVELEDTGEPPGCLAGFESLAQQVLVLTHPVAGAFHRLDGRLGGYSIWHPVMALSRARPRRLRFALYERLGLLSPAEMEQPHSALLSPEVEFDIHLPPRRL